MNTVLVDSEGSKKIFTSLANLVSVKKLGLQSPRDDLVDLATPLQEYFGVV